jgi:hypothetical protein
MRHFKYFSFIILSLLLLASCREKYSVSLKSSDRSALVVEGFLNAGNGPTIITLTRSYAANGSVSIPRVTGAQVTVEGNNGTSFSLAETGTNTGVYRHPQLNLLTDKQYRLKIRTTGGKEYLSDYVPVRLSPPIDSINWKWENNGVMIYANTHDASNNSRYYKWDYEETWEISTNYYSDVKLVSANPLTVVARNLPAEDVSRCWKYDNSRTIMIGSTAQLQTDIAFEIPLYFLQPNTERLGIRYSTLVKQSVLTKEAYEYFSLMKKNTEQLGSIFDPLPSELRGNIKCLTDADEQVVGYLTASSQQEKRIFITAQQLPGSIFNFPNCTSIMVPIHPDSVRKHIPTLMPYAEYRNQFNLLTHYFMAPPPCFDCTARGGINVKPSYW